MFGEMFTTLAAIPGDALKAIGGIAGTAAAAGTVYLWNRLRAPRHPTEAPTSRISLSPEDRDLGFTIVRTGTDLTRALHDHGELLRGFGGGSSPPPAPPTRRIRRSTP
ncbi:hypothetical protein [Methylobacterium sp. WL7]|uniref:hypothetical protein n=1 Tax=Methylobacterium sp. WL7 TaxID=2603900 RepID=UPI0011C85762|nr:hypothetical protein [Methylobacterium sp. WL7]TXN47362.1 hypothetical protein FV233_04860 [Methylobacterium sp. WL7]